MSTNNFDINTDNLYECKNCNYTSVRKSDF